MGPPPVVSLAPLQGMTDALFRRIFLSIFPGYDAAYAPFVKAVAGGFSDSHLRDLSEGPRPGYRLVPQLLTNRGDELAETAARLAALGFAEANVNMGCPFPMVANKRRGSGILAHPGLIDAMLAEALPACPIPLSIKLRLGREGPDEMAAVAEVLNRHPLSELILHPRTGAQMYEGEADLDRFEEFRCLSRHPVAYNGDILTRVDWQYRATRFPSVTHWMLGRGALRNPFLAAEIKGIAPPPAERRAAIRRFHDEYYRAEAARFGRTKQLLDIMKALWLYLAWSLPEPVEALKRARRVKDTETYERLAEELLG